MVVGFRGYMEQITSLTTGKDMLSMELGQELNGPPARWTWPMAGLPSQSCRRGMPACTAWQVRFSASLPTGNWDGETPRVITIPGVSALQSAASLLGSPLMQDFCAISLSNLLTPWRRLSVAWRRQPRETLLWPFTTPAVAVVTGNCWKPRRILLEHRAEATPVGLVREAYREDQQVALTDLAGLEARATRLTCSPR